MLAGLPAAAAPAMQQLGLVGAPFPPSIKQFLNICSNTMSLRLLPLFQFWLKLVKPGMKWELTGRQTHFLRIMSLENQAQKEQLIPKEEEKH